MLQTINITLNIQSLKNKKLYITHNYECYRLFSLVSCGNDDEKIKKIEFKTTGVILSSQRGNSYCSEIGYAGGKMISSLGLWMYEMDSCLKSKWEAPFMKLPISTEISICPIFFVEKNGNYIELLLVSPSSFSFTLLHGGCIRI